MAADIFFRAGKIEDSFKFLEELKTCRIKSQKCRVSFEYHVLKAMTSDYLLEGKPSSVKLSKEYNLNWEIITSIQSGDISNARLLWDQLISIFPNLYIKDFKCIKCDHVQKIHNRN